MRNLHYRIIFFNGQYVMGKCISLKVRREKYSRKILKVDISYGTTQVQTAPDSIMAVETWYCPDPMCM